MLLVETLVSIDGPCHDKRYAKAMVYFPPADSSNPKLFSFIIESTENRYGLAGSNDDSNASSEAQAQHVAVEP